MCDPNHYWNDNAAQTAELCDYINHPRLKICWDAGHGNLKEHTNRNLSQREALDLLGKRVYALHVQDNYGTDDDHVIPGFRMDLEKILYKVGKFILTAYDCFEE